MCIAKLYSPADDYKETTTHWKMHFKDEMLMFCCNVEAANWVTTTSSFMVTAVTGCLLNIVFFPYFFIFLNSASSAAAALVFYLPGVCTHTDTEGKQRKARVRNIFQNLPQKHNIQ